MEDWRDFQKRQLEEKLKDQAAKLKNRTIDTALSDLQYIEDELLPNLNSDAQFRIAQKTLMGVQVQFMRLQLEAMRIEQE